MRNKKKQVSELDILTTSNRPGREGILLALCDLDNPLQEKSRDTISTRSQRWIEIGSFVEVYVER